MKEQVQHTAWLSIGSNLGDRRENLQLALDSLDINPRVSVIAVSRVYKTAPIGSIYSDDFYNAVIGIKTSFSPDDLLNRCQEVESTFGRDRAMEDRTVDIDILLFDELVQKAHFLTIPHQELSARRFMLLPLLELLPDAIDPETRLPYKDLPAVNDENQRVELLDEILSWRE
jgi:2-amino-4-hydroxy-6-hydroxymethyldihydropteridine diphosphokinase